MPNKTKKLDQINKIMRKLIFLNRSGKKKYNNCTSLKT